MRSRGNAGKAASKASGDMTSQQSEDASGTDDSRSRENQALSNNKGAKNSVASAKGTAGKALPAGASLRPNYWRSSNICCVCTACIGV